MSQDRSPAQLESHFALAVRDARRAGSAANAQTTLLHIGEEHAAVLSGPGDQPASAHQLDLGSARMTRDYFHHDPPTSHEIERAIDFTEDQIMRMGKPAEAASTLWSASPALQAWAAVAGPSMPIEAVEQWFQRLVSMALGQPGAMQGLPPGREAAAALLVLREFMHHRGHALLVAIETPDDGVRE
jgi:exopolyphosphatase/pppGpp-phosphohydrolase